MNKHTPVYFWILIATVLLMVNVWILNGLDSNVTYAEEDSPNYIRSTLREAILMAKKLDKRRQKIDGVRLKLSGDPFVTCSQDKKESQNKVFGQKKFSIPSPPPVQLPQIDGIFTVKRLDGKETRYLVLKGKLYKEGDVFDGFQIRRITSNSVMLVSSGKNIVVGLSERKYGSIPAGNIAGTNIESEKVPSSRVN